MKQNEDKIDELILTKTIEQPWGIKIPVYEEHENCKGVWIEDTQKIPPKSLYWKVGFNSQTTIKEMQNMQVVNNPK